MAKKTQKKNAAAGGAGGAATRWVLSLVAIVVILLLSGYLFAGTDGFRSMVEARLASALGLPLEIGSSRALLNGDLEFGDVHTTNRVAEGAAGVQIDRAILGIDWWQLFGGDLQEAIHSVWVDGWQVNFAPDAHGVMQPSELSGASDWLGQWGGLALPGAAEPAAETAAPAVAAGDGDSKPALDRWQQTRFSLRRGDIEWWDVAGNVVVSVHAIDFHLTPLQLPTRPAAHYHATVKSAVLPGDQRVRDMDLELLRTGGTYLVLNLEMVRQTGGSVSRLPGTPAPAPPREEPIPAPTPVVEPAVTTDDNVQQYIRSELEDALRPAP